MSNSVSSAPPEDTAVSPPVATAVSTTGSTTASTTAAAADSASAGSSARHSNKNAKRPPGVFSLLRPYRKQVVILIVLAVVANAFTLVIPRLIADGIDAYIAGQFELAALVLRFGVVSAFIFFFTALQGVMQTVVSEQAAFDLRQQLVARISRQGYQFIADKNPAKLLTNLTSDIDSIKMFVSQVIVSLVTSAVIIIGAALIMLSIDWELALVVLLVIPLIGGTFFVILGKVRPYFKQGREVIDWLNKVIRESIIGAALIRVLDANRGEQERFNAANQRGLDIGLKIIRLFSFMIPIITFVASMGSLVVVTLGGYFVIQGDMSLGSFAAFMSYLMLLIFPILVIGFMSNIIAQASVSYARIREVLEAEEVVSAGTTVAELQGHISLVDINLEYGGKPVLKHISLTIQPGTRTAILGPTAAGKTQLLNIMAGLTPAPNGQVYYDGKALADYDNSSFYPQVGLVFQDSVLFSTTLRENIAFSPLASDASLELAVRTAELADYIATLPAGLDTNISERGTSLSGGQKQRVMLARALALNPKILFLDDFTARVDARTEQRILANITRNYPHLTLVSITQKIAPVQQYDQIILLMEGEILAAGTHEQLLHSAPEYVQIFSSQRSTSSLELAP